MSSKHALILEGNRLLNEGNRLEELGDLNNAADYYDKACAVFRGNDQNKSNETYIRAKKARAKFNELKSVEYEKENKKIEATEAMRTAVRMWDQANAFDQMQLAQERVDRLLCLQGDDALEYAHKLFDKGGFASAEYKTAKDLYLQGKDEEKARKAQLLLQQHAHKRSAFLFERAKNGDISQAAAIVDLISIFKQMEDFMAESHSHLALGQLLLIRGDLNGAEESFSAAKATFERNNDRQGRVQAIMWLGRLSILQGKFADAQTAFEGTFQYYEDGSDVVTLATVAVYLGEIAYLQGNLEMSERKVQSVMQRVDQSESRMGQARLNAHVAKIKGERGCIKEAIEMLEPAAAVLQTMGEYSEWINARVALVALKRISLNDTWLKDDEAAQLMLRQLIKMMGHSEEIQDRDYLLATSAYRNSGELKFLRGDYVGAEEDTRLALSASKSLSSVTEEAHCLIHHAKALAQLNKLDEADALLVHADAILRKFGKPIALIQCLHIRGRIMAGKKQWKSANDLLNEAKSIAENIGAKMQCALIIWSLAVVEYFGGKEIQSNLMSAVRALRMVDLYRLCVKCRQQISMAIYLCPNCVFNEFCYSCYSLQQTCHPPSVLMRPAVIP